MIPYIPTEDLSPYQYLDGRVVIILSLGTSTPKCDINNEVGKHDAKAKSQETPDIELFAPMNLNVISSPIYEQVLDQEETKNNK